MQRQTLTQTIAADPVMQEYVAAMQRLWRLYAEEQAIDVDKLCELLRVVDACARERRQELIKQQAADHPVHAL